MCINISTYLRIVGTDFSIYFCILGNDKSIIEITIQYIKDRTGNFDYYFPCRKKEYKLKHVKQWVHLFIDQYNKEIIKLTVV